MYKTLQQTKPISHISLKSIGITLIFSIALSACGGGGRGDASSFYSDDTIDDPYENAKNLALQSEGATVTSTISGNEVFVIDGDKSTDNYWEPEKAGDSITVELKEASLVENVKIYYNQRSRLGPDWFDVLVSSDGENFQMLNDNFSQLCDPLSTFSTERFNCDFFKKTVRYIRLTFSNEQLEHEEPIRIREIQVNEIESHQNYALPRSGAIVSSTNSEGGSAIIDGKVSEESYWSPSQPGDFILIELARDINVYNFSLYYSRVSSRESYLIETSKNGIDFEIFHFWDDCGGSWSSSPGRITCSFPENEFRFFKLIFFDDIETTKLHEVSIRDTRIRNL